MSNLIPSEPDGPERRKPHCKAGPKTHSGKEQKRDAKRDRRPPPTIASPEDCLSGLSQMPGMIALGILKTSQANAIRGVYSTILGHHQKAKETRTDQTLDNESLLKMLRKDPAMINLLAPLLTADQIKMLIQDDTDGDETDGTEDDDRE
jgi:hypothetical protein